MRRFRVSFTQKLFHNNHAEPLGTIRATETKGIVILHKFNFVDVEKLPDGFIPAARAVIRGHVQEFLKDTRYCVMWNEETGIQSTITEL